MELFDSWNVHFDYLVLAESLLAGVDSVFKKVFAGLANMKLVTPRNLHIMPYPYLFVKSLDCISSCETFERKSSIDSVIILDSESESSGVMV